jgi:hypothetical protein
MTWWTYYNSHDNIYHNCTKTADKHEYLRNHFNHIDCLYYYVFLVQIHNTINFFTFTIVILYHKNEFIPQK